MVAKIRRGDKGDVVARVQACLAEAGLEVNSDGVYGIESERTVIAYHRTRRLKPDGIVGIDTLEALGLNWAVLDPAAFRAEVVRLARREVRRWRGRLDTDPETAPFLVDYYQTGVQMRVATESLSQPAFHESNPWSAVFISWLMRQAGAGGSFAYSRAHQTYVAEAKRNRQRQDRTKPFWAYRIEEAAPQPGDLVITSRAGSGATYDNIDRSAFLPTHGDLVVEAAQNRLLLVGGNVNGGVRRTTLATDASGLVALKGAQSDYFAVVRLQRS